MKSLIIASLSLLLLSSPSLIEVSAKAQAKTQEQFIKRAAVTGRSGPGTFFDAVIVLKRGRAVKVTETVKRWAKVSAGKHKVWIPKNGLSKAPKKSYDAVNKADTAGIAASPAGLAAAAKGFAGKFAKRIKRVDLDTLTRARMSPKAFAAELERFHAKHPTRAWSFRSEEVESPSVEGFEEKLGLAVAAKLVAHYGLVADRSQERALTALANIIGLQSARFDIPWRVFVLDSDELNAFGLSGGYILVTRGLLAACRSLDERAAVLAHEVAHVVRYHNVREVKERRVYLQADAAQQAMDAAFGEEPDPDVDALGAVALDAYTFLHKDRLESHEYEADHLAAVYLYRAGLSPQALIRLLSEVKAKRGEAKAYSGHPAFSERIKKLNTHLRSMR